jgi:hypothetical protein
MHFLAYSSTGCALVGKCEPALDDIGCMTMHYILRILSRALGICLSKCLGQVKTHIHINLSVPVSLCLSTLYTNLMFVSLYFPSILVSSRLFSSLRFASLRFASLLFSSFPPPVFLHVYPALSVYVMVDQKSFIRKRPFFANNNVTLSLSLYLSISLSISLSLYISISLSLCLSISPSIHPFIHPSNLSTVTYFSYLPISLSTNLPIYLSIYPSIHLSTSTDLSIYPYYPSIDASMYTSIYLIVDLSIYLSA